MHILGLGVGLTLGYHSRGLLAKPVDISVYKTYRQIHRYETYNRRPDGLLECAVSDSVVYIKAIISLITERK